MNDKELRAELGISINTLRRYIKQLQEEKQKEKQSFIEAFLIGMLFILFYLHKSFIIYLKEVFNHGK